MKSTRLLFALGSFSAILIAGCRLLEASLAPIFFLQGGSGASMTRSRFLSYLRVYADLLAKASRAGIFQDPGRDSRTELDTTDLILGSPITLYHRGNGQEWIGFPFPERSSYARATDDRTLLISPSLDISTPPQFTTKELAPFLNNGEPDDSRCIYQLVRFDLGAGWPALAKIAFALALGDIAPLVSTVWLRFVVFNFVCHSPWMVMHDTI